MEALIDAEMSENNDGSFGDDDDDENDDGSFGDDDSNDECPIDNNNVSENTEFDKTGNNNNDGDATKAALDESEDENSYDMKRGHSHRLVDKTVVNPDNFSKIEANQLDNKAKLAAQFPDILSAKPAFCDVNAGDILYLPASWFHEVTSFGDHGKVDNDNDGNSRDHGDGHLALNYWFHPPDAPDNFEQPYSTDFWPNDYKMRFTAAQNTETP